MRTPRLIVSQVRIFLARLTYYALFFLLFIGVFYFLFFSEWLEIHNINLEGNNSVDKKIILDTIEPYLHKKRFFIFPSNNFFWVPSNQIEKEITNSYKRISSASVKGLPPHTLSIKVKEKKAVLLFCSNKGCAWVDEEGIAYNKSSYAEAAVVSAGVVIVQDNSEKDIILGQAVTSPEYVDYTNNLNKLFPEKVGKEIGFFSTPLPSAEEIRTHVKEGWIAYFDITLDLGKSLVLLGQVINQNLPEENKSADCLEYVDLRVADKIFYKLKEGCGEDNPEKLREEQIKAEEGNGEQLNPANTNTDNKPANNKKSKKKKKKN